MTLAKVWSTFVRVSLPARARGFAARRVFAHSSVMVASRHLPLLDRYYLRVQSHLDG